MIVPSRIRAAVVTLKDLLDTGPDDISREKEEGSQRGLSAPVDIYGVKGCWGASRASSAGFGTEVVWASVTNTDELTDLPTWTWQEDFGLSLPYLPGITKNELPQKS